MRRYPKMVSIAFLLFVFLAAGCQPDDGDSGDSTIAFAGGPCKKEVHAKRILWSLYTQADEASLAGLKCVSFQQAASDSLKIDLINFEGVCGSSWDGNAAAGEAGLTLNIVNSQGDLPSCGWCIYDWSFEVSGLDLSKNVKTSIIIDTMPQDDELETMELTLPTADQTEGLLCQWANWHALEWQAEALGTCGTIHMPCAEDGSNGMCSELEDGPCTTGHTCAAPYEGANTICMKPCEKDEDCPNTDALFCDKGYCQLKSPW